MITKKQLAQAWNTFSEKMSELRKRRQEIVVAYDRQKSQEKIQQLYRKIVEIPED
jgi:septum formation topological specificity factor MinE